MRFADIHTKLEESDKSRWDIYAALSETLDALAAQEAIRESVPVRSLELNLERDTRKFWREQREMRSPEPAGPTLAEQIDFVHRLCRQWQEDTEGGRAMRAILATLERLARETE